MKIGILTLPILKNYGGILQAYALQTSLRKMGHEPYMIMRRMDERQWYVYPLLQVRFYMRKLRGIKEDSILVETRKGIKGGRLVVETKKFIDRYINPKTDRYFSSEELKHNIKKEKFEAYIVGSDQVWRPKYSSNIYDFFLDFAQGEPVVKIAYAASFGTSEWEYTPEQTSRCQKLLSKFSAISVREEDAKTMVENHFGQNAEHVLDPTMLLTREDYINNLKLEIDEKLSNQIFSYVLDSATEVDHILEKVSSQFNLEVSRMTFEDKDVSLFSKPQPYPSVEKWLQGFYSSPFIITDSFHGCVFSILFNKPFIVYGNKERGLSRFTSLLKIFSLEERLCQSIDDLDKIIRKTIDWDNVNRILEQNRKKSLSFLMSSLDSNIIQEVES